MKEKRYTDGRCVYILVPGNWAVTVITFTGKVFGIAWEAFSWMLQRGEV